MCTYLSGYSFQREWIWFGSLHLPGVWSVEVLIFDGVFVKN